MQIVLQRDLQFENLQFDAEPSRYIGKWPTPLNLISRAE